MSYCKHCWNELEPNVKFCDHCGAPASPVDYKRPIIKIIIKRTTALLLVFTLAILGWLVFINGVKVGECVKLWNTDTELWQSSMDTQSGQSLVGTIKRDGKASKSGEQVFALVDTVGEASTEIVDGIINMIPAPTPVTITVKTDLFGSVEAMEIKIPPHIASGCSNEDVLRVTAKAAAVMHEKDNYSEVYQALKSMGTVDGISIKIKGAAKADNSISIKLEYISTEEE